MKITKSQLKRIIKEELQRIIEADGYDMPSQEEVPAGDPFKPVPGLSEALSPLEGGWAERIFEAMAQYAETRDPQAKEAISHNVMGQQRRVFAVFKAAGWTGPTEPAGESGAERGRSEFEAEPEEEI